MELSDEVLLSTLSEIDHRRLDPDTQDVIAFAEREGSQVTLFEVQETGAVLVIVHQTKRPSMEAIRTAYQRHRARGLQ